jgi:hypothetical protein
VDTVETAIVPALLGRGVPMPAGPACSMRLTLTGHKTYKTGIVSLEYAVV